MSCWKSVSVAVTPDGVGRLKGCEGFLELLSLQRPSRPPTRREGLRNAFYWIACLVAPPPPSTSSSDLQFVCVCVGMCQKHHYNTLPGREECAFVHVVSVFLSARTWIFHVHCDHRCFLSISLTDYSGKDCTSGPFLFLI